MSKMTLIRHGQASFFAADYDRLTSLGEDQSRLLGRYWADRDCRFDQVYMGPRMRQQQTAQCIGESFRQAGIDWPVPTVLWELDEYDLTGLKDHLVPALMDRDPNFASLVAANKQSALPIDQLRSFQLMFEQLLLCWQSEDIPLSNVESWSDFRNRVEMAVGEIQRNAPKGCRVAIVTSGGFIGTATQWTLAAPARSALELNWRVRNCSLTEFVFTRDRLTLDSFNAVPHLPDPTHWTYR